MTAVMVMWRFGQCAFNAPSGVESQAHGQARFFLPVSHRARHATKRDLAIVAAIARLGCVCRPSAIVRRVGTIVINALDRMFTEASHLWSRSHIRVEVLKRLAPAVTNHDATATIVVIRRIVRVVASLNNRQPDVVLRRMPLSVGATHRGGVLAAQAAATALAAVTQQQSLPNACGTAITSTAPRDRQVITSALNHDEAAKALAG